MMPIRLSIVVPCYNEEEVLPETSKRLVGLLARLRDLSLVTDDSAVYFVDDGSKDKTWPLITALAISTNGAVHGIKLSRNQGHQSALLAGLFDAPGDAVVTIDADLQDDVNVIEEMVRCHQLGCDIVLGVRKSRRADTVFKRLSAQSYYRLLGFLGVNAVYNHADYRLMSRRAIDSLRRFSEVNLFLRGVIPLLGFPTTQVYYDRAERLAGQSKYPLRRMLALALDGITSFSVTPLRFIAALGFLICLGSICMIGWVLYGALYLQGTVPGWASSVLPVYFLGGIQLLSIGVLGEYVAKTYLETKRRPRYFVEAVAELGPERPIADIRKPAHANTASESIGPA
ncbi:MAG: glycosyltransferase family 2 protein [Bryobacteraceae bacterium]